MTDFSPPIKALQKIRPIGAKFPGIPATTRERQAAKYRGVCHIEGLSFQKKLALTFDDGPSELTGSLLDLLKVLGVRATFFWIGQNLNKSEDLAIRALADGHAFGNHSFDHPNFTKISIDEVVSEQIGKTQSIFRKIIGVEPSLVRPPFGDVTDGQIEALNDMGMNIIFWSIDARDWIEENNNAVTIAKRVLDSLHEEAIILMHDGGSARTSTVHAVGTIVDSCRKRGFEFVSVDDLIGAKKGPQKAV